MVAFVTRMPAGVVGAISRDIHDATVVPEIIDSANPPTRYGSPVKLVAGKLQPLASGDDGTAIHGWPVRAYPIQSTSDALGAAAPPARGMLDTLRRGFMAVQLAAGAAAKKGQVYVVTTAGGALAVGDVVTSASPAGGGTAVEVAGAYFTGPADPGGIIEIEFNL